MLTYKPSKRRIPTTAHSVRVALAKPPNRPAPPPEKSFVEHDLSPAEPGLAGSEWTYSHSGVYTRIIIGIHSPTPPLSPVGSLFAPPPVILHYDDDGDDEEDESYRKSSLPLYDFDCRPWGHYQSHLRTASSLRSQIQVFVM